MAKKVLISQEIITFKENDRQKWYQELDKDNPFEADSNIISSIIPFYNRRKTINKAIERPERYFRECCVIKAYSPKFDKGYYTHSIHLFYSKKWLNGIPPTELFQKELFDDLHNHRYFPPERLKAAQERNSKSDYLIREKLNPKMPDVWLAKDYPNSIFIEVKRLREDFVAGQKEGLAIIKKYLGCDIRIARVCSENENHQGIEFPEIDITEHCCPNVSRINLAGC